MAKQLNVNLAFTADTAQAKTSLRDLQNQLTQLQSVNLNSKNVSGMNQEITKSIGLVTQLKTQLIAATNVNTGKLDLTKFAESMNKAQISVSDYQKALSNLGPAGDKAFMDLARAVTNAEVPLKRCNTLLTNFAVTLKNTVRWQLSSSALHSFMGTLQSAYGYAKDLNESLNNIRIVTGYSEEHMANFAKEANNAAKALSTTTTAYTDASLIFYQQGLDDEVVKERTNTVIKMANVTRDAETDVASYMTAIWNNFEGEKEHLEEYADVITALGASTASSSAEIAGGLEKFAAVGQQIGLSYDYAATALATVVANTRQSEDVVGTAFKTIFSRIQGLKLGETLEDGTDYNKYSKALASVGVDIKDINGQIKDMDDILDELGQKWSTLGRDQQMAVAQTVAGVRQYNQFMALMNAFQGEFQKNLEIARDSEGSLEKQQKTFEEGWEGASKRLRTTWEELFQTVLDDKAFIKLTDGLTHIIDAIAGISKGLGGMSGVLALVSTALIKTFSGDITQLVDNLSFRIQGLLGKTQETAMRTREQFYAVGQKMQADSSMPGSTEAADVYKAQIGSQKIYMDNAQKINESQKEMIQGLMDIQNQNGQISIEMAKQAEITRQLQQTHMEENVGWYEGEIAGYEEMSKTIAQLSAEKTKYANFSKAAARIMQTESTDIEKVIKALNRQAKAYGLDEKSIEKLTSALRAGEKPQAALNKLRERAKKINSDLTQAEKKLATALQQSGESANEAKSHVNGIAMEAAEAANAENMAADASEHFANSTQLLNDTITNTNGFIASLGMKATVCLSAMSSMGMAISSVHGILNTLTDDTTSFGDKLLSVSVSGPMAISMLVSACKGLVETFGLMGVAQDAYLVKQTLLLAGTTKLTGAQALQYISNLALADSSVKVATNQTAVNIAKALGIEVTDAMTMAELKEAIAAAAAKAATLPLIAIFAALAVVILGAAAAIAIHNKHLEENSKQWREDADAANENLKATQQATQQQGDLIQSFNEAYDVYQKTGTVTEELKTATDALTDAYELQGGALAKLSGNYDNFIETLRDTRQAEIDTAVGAANEAVTENTNGLVGNLNQDFSMLGLGSWYADAGVVQGPWENTPVSDYLMSHAGDGFATPGQNGFSVTWDANDSDSTIAAYEYMLQLYNEIGNSGDAADISSDEYINLGKQLDEYRQYYDDLIAAKQELAELNGEQLVLDKLDINGTSIDTAKDYVDIRQQLIDTLAEQRDIEADNTAEMAKLRGEVDEYIARYTNGGQFAEVAEAITSVSDLTGISQEQIADFYDNLSEEDKKVFFSIDFDTFKTTESWEEQVQILQDLAANTQIQAGIDIQASTNQAILSNSGLKDKQRESVEEYYGDNVDWETFDRVNQSQQIEMIAEAQNQINKEVLETVENRKEDAEALQNELEAAQEYAEQTALAAQQTHDDNGIEYSEEYKKELEETARAAQEAVDVIQDQLDRLNDPVDWNNILLGTWDSAVNGLVDEMNAVANTTSLIGENFQVAADDVRALVAEFPGILEGAEVTADGVITLNKDVVDNILAGKSAEIEADKEAAKEQLQNKIELLKAENECNQTKLDLINQFLAGEIDANQLESEMTQAQTDFETKCLDIIGDTDAKLDIEAAQNNYQLTGTVLENLDQIGLRAQAVGEAIRAAMSGETVNYLDQGNTGSNSVDINHDDYDAAADLNAEMENFDQFYQNMQAQRDSLQAAIDANNQLIDGLEADVLKLEGGASDLLNRFNSVRNGESGDGKASKNSSKEKEKSEKELKNLDKEIERYAEIKELLDDIKREHDRLSKAKDRSWGAGRVKAINAEQAALQKQLGTLKQDKNQVQSFLNQDAVKAASFGASIVDGHISNFNDVITGLTNDYNAAVTAYNGTAAGSDEEKAASKAIEDAEKRLSDAKEAMKQYEETKDLVEDITDQITDTIFQIADLDLERITYIVELKLDLDDRQLRLIDDILEDLGDSADNALDSIEKMEDAIDTIFQSIIDNKDGVKELLDYVGVSGADSAAFLNGTLSKGGADNIAGILQTMVDDDHPINYDEVISKLEEYTDNLLDANEKLRQYRDQVFETLTNAMSEYLGDLNRISDKIAHITKLTQGYKDLITSIGKSNLDPTGALTQKINKTLQSEAESAYKSAKATQEYAQVAYNEALEGYQIAVDTGDEYAIRKWKEILEQAEDDLNDAEEATLESMTALADAIATVFTESISQAVETMNRELGGLSVIREKFDQAKELSAQYLDDYKKIYELSKLNREVNASIDDTDNIRAKQLLMEYQQKIVEYQKDGVEMSQYEVDYLRAQYDFILARIAIEEAQKAKSQVSMVQDSEGNYSYVYTADDQAVADAEQNYEDKLYAMQVLNGEYINELQENLIAMQEEMGQKLEEIAENDALTYEEKKELIAETTEYYLERINFYSDQLGISFDNNSQLYEKDWQEYHDKTGYKISANEDYIDSWEETSLAIITNVNSQQEYLRILETAIREARDTSREACDTATESLNNVGFTSQVLGNVIDQMTHKLENDARRASMSAEQMSREYQSAVTQIMNSVQAFTSTYCSQITAIIAQNQALIASMNAVIAAAAAMAAAVGAHSGGYYGNPGSTGSPAKPTGAAPAANQNKGSGLTAEQIEGIAGNIWIYGSWGNNPTRQATMIDKFGQADGMAIYNAVQDKFNSGYGYGGGLEHDWDYYKKFSPSAFATGGYTGDWGSTEGKLALLHEKELVLNQYDTANMLQMIDMVRKIANTIDINALSSMGANLQAISSNIGNETEKLEQEVHITAEFPGVSDRNEILAAFDNVINLASQYANRK